VPDALLAAVSEATAEAGRLALKSFGGTYRQWEKEPGHPVSDIDLAVDALLHERLLAIDPDAGWLSEETVDSAERLMRVRTWVVDPIDGTRDYLRGRPGWAVSVALVEGGRPLLGRARRARAGASSGRRAAGSGAFCNGRPLSVRACHRLRGARMPIDALPRSERDLVAVAKPNSIALRIAMVAAGDADLVATVRWGNEWDIAAAALIAQEAGAIVTDAFGAPLRYNSTRGEAFGLVAAAPGIHAAMVERVSARATVAAAR
jgi:myo-inositol-1(or 4)-monophosphatase